MPGETKHGADCTEFEALLMDALDGDRQLTGARKERFDAHRRMCAVCGPLFADVEAGREWLRSLAPVEPPVYLVHNILAATSGVLSTRPAATAGSRGTTPFGERTREWWDSWFTTVFAFVRQPRFAMSFGMIFFSFSMILSLAGFKPADMARIDLRPAAVRHVYNDAQIKVVKYYDNIRFVYEIESKVRELKRATAPAEPGPQPQKENRKNDTSGQPNQRQDRNYSHQQGQTVLAALEVRTDQVLSLQAASLKPRAAIELQATSELFTARGSQLATRGSVMVTTNRRFV